MAKCRGRLTHTDRCAFSVKIPMQAIPTPVTTLSFEGAQQYKDGLRGTSSQEDGPQLLKVGGAEPCYSVKPLDGGEASGASRHLIIPRGHIKSDGALLV